VTIERSLLVPIPSSVDAQVSALSRQAEEALRRSAKLPPGDRSELLRFEAIHAVIDQIAIALIAGGGPYMVAICEPLSFEGVSILQRGDLDETDLPGELAGWFDSGASVVELRIPQALGDTIQLGKSGVGPPPPARRWAGTKQKPKDAIKERFEAFLNDALTDADDAHAAILPSGVNNDVLADALRHAVAIDRFRGRLDAPVRYPDGSGGAAFPLRCLELAETVPEGWRELRFALMSMRHPELDGIVDGAWFRNSRLSRGWEHGRIDDIAFASSQIQLNALSDEAPTLIYMYQTGFPPAMMGFYRAVVHHLLTRPGTIAVIPMYFRQDQTFDPGQLWATE
jgi:hypothetical protein